MNRDESRNWEPDVSVVSDALKQSVSKGERIWTPGWRVCRAPPLRSATDLCLKGAIEPRSLAIWASVITVRIPRNFNVCRYYQLFNEREADIKYIHPSDVIGKKYFLKA